jgi:hypothetical protein
MQKLANGELQGLAALNREINRHLDATVEVWIMDAVAALEGKKSELNDPGVQAVMREISGKVAADQAGSRYLRWPDLSDLAELLKQHYAGRARGPTVAVGPDGTVFTRWWLGIIDFHRDPKEGPANIEEKGERRREEYWFNGKLHRPHADGPAVIYTHYKDFDLSGEEYFEHGRLHRPAHSGPAVTHRDRTGRIVLELYFENQELHRDPKQGPAWFEIRDAATMKGTPDNTTLVQYCVHGQGHRDEDDGPAVFTRDNKTAVLLTEWYYRNGVFHRDRGPAQIERKEDGTPFLEGWMRNGERHRPAHEGPAFAIRQGNGISIDEWWVMGKRHRDPKDGPALIQRDAATGEVQEEFWIDGNYRPASDGPAWITRDQDGKVIEQRFWDGERLCPRPPVSNQPEGGAHG